MCCCANVRGTLYLVASHYNIPFLLSFLPPSPSFRCIFCFIRHGPFHMWFQWILYKISEFQTNVKINFSVEPLLHTKCLRKRRRRRNKNVGPPRKSSVNIHWWSCPVLRRPSYYQLLLTRNSLQFQAIMIYSHSVCTSWRVE